MVGASETSQRASGELDAGPMHGTLSAPSFRLPYLFGKYERNKLMLAGEYTRLALSGAVEFNGLPPIPAQVDQRAFYGMASYKLTDKLTSGLYYSSTNDHKAAFTSNRYQKDWAIAARYAALGGEVCLNCPSV